MLCGCPTPRPTCSTTATTSTTFGATSTTSRSTWSTSREPFNSNADYNVLFAEKSGEKAQAQIKAFEDTWEWGLEAAQEYAEVLRSGHDSVAKALKVMHDFLGGSDPMRVTAEHQRESLSLRIPGKKVCLHVRRGRDPSSCGVRRRHTLGRAICTPRWVSVPTAGRVSNRSRKASSEY